MPLKIAIQMDPIEHIATASDTTFMLALEAQARGHELFVYEVGSLALEDGTLTASVRAVRLRDEPGRHVEAEAARRLDLGEMDVVLMRQDPPFDMVYITATYLLETIHPRTLVVNDPAHVRSSPEKLFATRFGQFHPPTLISADSEALADFHRRHGDVILKPLHGAAGSGVIRLKADDANLGALIEIHAQASREPLVMQAFIPAVVKGDKRIILVDGEPVGAINRVPADGQVRSNLRVGGRAEAVELTDSDRAICAAIGPELSRLGLLFVGIDVIGEHLTEINVTSPTGARQLKAFGGGDAAARLWDVIEARRAAR